MPAMMLNNFNGRVDRQQEKAPWRRPGSRRRPYFR
jgi:hypothetical protein